MNARNFLKRVVMWTYNRGWVSGTTVLRAFKRFDLWGA